MPWRLAVSLSLPLPLPLLLSPGLAPGASSCPWLMRLRCRSCRLTRLPRQERLEPSNSANASSLVHCWQKRSGPLRLGMASALA